MECLPEGGWFSRGRGPSENHPHWHGIFVLLYQANPNLVKYQWKQQWLPVDPVRTVDVLQVDISPVDMMEWPTFVSQSRLTIFMWGIIISNIPYEFNAMQKYMKIETTRQWQTVQELNVCTEESGGNLQ